MAGKVVVCTNSKKIYDKAKLFSHHGIDKKITGGTIGPVYWVIIIIGQIFRQHAIAQLDRINYLLKYKLKIYQLYKKYFSRIKNVEITKELKNQKQTFWIVYAIINKKIDKENFCNKFKNIKLI